jgi:hypothetical protein
MWLFTNSCMFCSKNIKWGYTRTVIFLFTEKLKGRRKNIRVLNTKLLALMFIAPYHMDNPDYSKTYFMSASISKS